MTPAEKKKQKRARVFRVAVPVLLAGMFASLAVLENKDVFSAVNKAKAPVAEHPAAVPVPFTGRAVVNRLENENFSMADGQLMRNGEEAGTLSLPGEEEIDSLCYLLTLLPAEAKDASDTAFSVNQADGENARLVFRAALEAVLGGEEPKEKLIEQGEKKLTRCLEAKNEKTETLSLSSGSILFEKVLEDGIYTLRITAVRE